MEERVA